MLPGQMSPWQLESVLDVPRNLPIKFHQNKVSNLWDIPDLDKCRLDKCCIDKCHRSSAGDGWPSPGSRCPCAWPPRRPFKHSTWPNKLISRRKTTRIDCVSLPVEVPLDVPDLVHLVAQQGSELDPKCDTKIKMPYLTGIQWWWSQVSRTQIEIFFPVRMPWRSGRPPQLLGMKKTNPTPGH